MWKLRHTLSLLALARLLYGQSLPYNPSYILFSPNISTGYIFQPPPVSSTQCKFQAIDFTKTVYASSLAPFTSSNTLPFLSNDELVPFTPVVEADGSVTVLAGKCADGAGGAQVWRYASEDEDGNYKWKQSDTSGLGNTAGLTGSNFLAAGVSFSENINGADADTSIYVFGGMCPSSTDVGTTWQSDAEYSNSMLKIVPQGSNYGLSVVSSRGPPIPQAGVSITPLPPTYSTNSEGNPLGQQQDFVLLGGHTQSAFINTSQVALFSLPQESWSFVPVEQPSPAKTDLAIRQSSQEVTPRSGHTAVLAEDGKSIILLGGWVGDVNTAAEPQLAILELGAGYGGSGAWKWTIPDLPKDVLAGSGIFGHGAVMLPGGVMMVVGGYEISAASKLFRRSTAAAGNRVLFYNATSKSWIDSYTAPANTNAQSDNKGALGSTSQKVGLGTGLGIGAALLVTVVVFYFWYSKRLQRAREERARTLLTYSSDGSAVGHMDQPFLDRGGIDGRGGEESALGRFWPTGGQAGSAFPRPPPMQHTTGMFVNVPSPTRGLRKGAGGRNYQYHAAPRYDEKRMSKASRNIHPIAEQENEDGAEIVEEGSKRDGLSDAEDKLREVERMLAGDDPFADPLPNPLGSHPVSPEDTVRRVPTGASRISIPRRKPVPSNDETPNWVEIGLDEAPNEDAAGRISPSKTDDRTSSTLSECSQRSVASTSSITRTMSNRTGAMMAAAMAARRQGVDQNSPTDSRTNTMSTDGGSIALSYFRTRARASTNGSVTPGGLQSIADDGDSIVTSGSNMAQLQSDGKLMLGGHSGLDRDGPYQRALVANTPTSPTSRPQSNRGPPPIIPQRRRPGLMGSLRRALNVMSMTERTLSLTNAVTEPYKDEIRSSSSSPTKERPSKAGNAPRRAVSDGGALLKQKRGQKDWNKKEWPPYKDIPDPGDWGEPRTSEENRQAEEDWDVEGAAINRDFQVMFSVPKARLRVVNDDMDRASLRSASDGAVSRNSSVKQLTREESLKVLKARAEGGQPRLPSTEEKEEESEKAKAA